MAGESQLPERTDGRVEQVKRVMVRSGVDAPDRRGAAALGEARVTASVGPPGAPPAAGRTGLQ